MEIALLVLFIQNSNYPTSTLKILLDLVRSKAIMEAGSSKTNDSSTGQAVTFTLDFTEPAKKPGRMPKNLSAARNRKHELSQASIAEKQRMAEQRRKVRAIC